MQQFMSQTFSVTIPWAITIFMVVIVFIYLFAAIGKRTGRTKERRDIYEGSMIIVLTLAEAIARGGGITKEPGSRNWVLVYPKNPRHRTHIQGDVDRWAANLFGQSVRFQIDISNPDVMIDGKRVEYIRLWITPAGSTDPISLP